MAAALDTLRDGEWVIDEHTDTYLSGQVTAGEDEILFTTIPYEPGWSITVDGEKVEPVKLVGSLIGINVPAGTHTVNHALLAGLSDACHHSLAGRLIAHRDSVRA